MFDARRSLVFDDGAPSPVAPSPVAGGGGSFSFAVAPVVEKGRGAAAPSQDEEEDVDALTSRFSSQQWTGGLGSQPDAGGGGGGGGGEHFSADVDLLPAPERCASPASSSGAAAGPHFLAGNAAGHHQFAFTFGRGSGGGLGARFDLAGAADGPAEPRGWGGAPLSPAGPPMPSASPVGGGLDSSGDDAQRSPIAPPFASAAARRKRRQRQPLGQLTSNSVELGSRTRGNFLGSPAVSPGQQQQLLRASCPNPLVSPSCGGAKRRSLAVSRRLLDGCGGGGGGNGLGVPAQETLSADGGSFLLQMLKQPPLPPPPLPLQQGGAAASEHLLSTSCPLAGGGAGSFSVLDCGGGRFGHEAASSPPRRVSPAGYHMMSSPLAGTSEAHILPTVEDAEHGE